MTGEKPEKRVEGRGYVMVADVEEFSKRDMPDQYAIVRAMSAFVMQHAIFQELQHGNDYALNSTGDGFLLVVRHGAPGIAAREMVAFAADLVDWTTRPVSEDPPISVKIRVGLDCGHFYFDVKLFGLEHMVVGSGPNWCTRVASIAGPSQVLVSERFFWDIKPFLQKRDLENLLQPIANPIRALVKHGELARVRAVRRAPCSLELSRPIRTATQVEDQLWRELEVVLRTVVLFLEGPGVDLAASETGPRATLWEPDYDRGVLNPRMRLKYDGERWIDGDEVRVPATRYEINPPQGPLARCLQSPHRPVLLHELPSYQDDRPGYLARLRAEGLSDEQITKMSRHSRAFVGIPCSLGMDAEGYLADVVLCIDLAHALGGMGEKALEMCEDIWRTRSRLVAALWRLRRG